MLNSLGIFILLFITHTIFSLSIVSPKEREHGLVLIYLPTVKFKQQQFLNRGEGLQWEPLVMILKYYRNVF